MERCCVLAEIQPTLLLDSHLRIVWYNNEAARRFSPEQGGEGSEIFADAAGSRFVDLCARCFQTREKNEALLVGTADTCAAQSVFRVICLPVISAKGDVEELLVVFYDVYELYSLEKKLQSAWKMDALIAEARRGAHDFNNCLTPVLGHCEILRLQLKRLGVDDPALLSSLDEIALSARGAKERVDRMLTSLQPVRTERIQRLQPVLYDVLDVLQVFSSEQVELVADISDQAGQALFDYEEMRQVLFQLSLNGIEAVTATSRRGWLRLTLREEMASAPCLSLVVADSGCGISQENQQQLFSPDSASRKGGKGLGLIFVQASIRAWGGNITVESVVGEGSVFTVTLPLYPK